MEEPKDKNKEQEIEYHDNIIDPQEISALEQLKNSLATVTDNKDKAVLDIFILCNNDFLIRFLRAKKLNVKKTTRMILDYFHWKAKLNLEDIYLNYEFKEKYKMQIMFPHGFHKITKDGYPVYFEIIGNFNVEEFFKIAPIDEMMRYEAKIMETIERDYFKICSKLKGAYIYGIFSIMDFKGINSSILNKKLFSYMSELSKLQEYYPENLAGCYVINAGIIFRSLYFACKAFLSETNKQKIKVFGDNYKEALLEKINKEDLPKFYGGVCECPGGCLFSNAGPWKKQDEIEENIPEDILKKRKEINDIMTFGKIQVSAEDQIKDYGTKGANLDEL